MLVTFDIVVAAPYSDRLSFLEEFYRGFARGHSCRILVLAMGIAPSCFHLAIGSYYIHCFLLRAAAAAALDGRVRSIHVNARARRWGVSASGSFHGRALQGTGS
jgi:hypothetical protein